MRTYAEPVCLCLDVYVWIPGRSSEIFRQFIDTYVDVDDPGDERFHTFTRVHVLGITSDTDAQALDDLRRADGDDAFTLYLRARDHYGAIITITRDGATVLGLSIEAPDDLPETLKLAEQLMKQLRQQFSAPAGCAGVELPPAGDRSEWYDEGLVLLRMGELPAP
ncbi:hypothetical protein [Planomonospora parontospora]|uniref:hypothetical protein n=1 Tax=Planomonospora parontospora TaxID=58119 RepID=UPI0016717B8F|nr:hypothetical protein [Planomonospora parontospora]GGL27047.1 hypothetical protein GCM10014719_30720 [Planomonospora parontospora subsp. antibiotica]GII16571.1 hypothetical protein Ppa05_32970 [Planomonospora parontospora subsp. antibiotica]